MIDVVAVTRRYGTLTAVSGVSFQVAAGEVVALLGPNGAGKTTIMRMITGYHYPHEGRVKVGGYDVVAETREVRRLTGYVPEGAPLYGELTVREYLRFVGRARGMGRSGIRTALERVVDVCRLPAVLDRTIEELSRGFRQRTVLAQAILHEPQVLVLDEPTSGLDPNQVAELRTLIRQLAATCTVLLSTHVLREVEASCSRALILDRGRLVASGTLAELHARVAGRNGGGMSDGLERVFASLTAEATDA